MAKTEHEVTGGDQGLRVVLDKTETPVHRVPQDLPDQADLREHLDSKD